MKRPELIRYRWPDTDGDFEVTLHFSPIEGRMECVGVDVRSFRLHGPDSASALPKAEVRVVTSSVLRGIRLVELGDRARGRMHRFLEDMAEAGVSLRDDYRVAWTERSSKPGRPPIYGPEHYERVASVYREAFARDRKPTRAVARAFGPGTTEAAASKWVARCREMGLLPPTTRGKARAAPPQERPRKGKR